jgi:predicted RNA-binding Zn ribbon-like protein
MDKSLYLLGGAAWLNLVNTTYLSHKQVVDILQDQSRTMQWLTENNLLRESDALAWENGDLLPPIMEDLPSLRQLCKEILSDIDQQGKLSLHTTDQLQKLVGQVQVRLALVPAGEKPELVCEGATPGDHVRYKIARSIIHTLASYPTDRIRKCEHEDCILYFLDTSKSGKRRWCSMEMCGNRQKAADYYARKKKKGSREEA